jgi:hypothetical protein
MTDITISSTGSYDLMGTLTSGTNIDFIGVGGTLTIEPAAITTAGIGGTISNFETGDHLTINNFGSIITEFGYPADSIYATYLQGSALTIAASGSVSSTSPLYNAAGSSTKATITTIADDLAHGLFGAGPLNEKIFLSFVSDAVNPSLTDVGVTAVACFAAGTRLLSPAGEVAVETIVPGDCLVTPRAPAMKRRVIWVGRRTVDLLSNRFARPVRVTAGAISPGVPERDLRLSPEHALFVNDAFVEAISLVNGTTIFQEQGGRSVTYYHIELDAHDVVLAEGCPAESYDDRNNRDMFAEWRDAQTGAWTRLAVLPAARDMAQARL